MVSFLIPSVLTGATPKLKQNSPIDKQLNIDKPYFHNNINTVKLFFWRQRKMEDLNR